MNLLSLQFFIDFTIFFILYWLVQPFRYIQNIFLMIFGIFFLISNSIYSFIVLVIWSLIIWMIILLQKHTINRRKINILLFLLVIIFLFIFRYYRVIQETINIYSLNNRLSFSLPPANIAAPLGLSFYVFHSISYVVSLQTREIKKDSGALPFQNIDANPRNFFSIFSYLVFFPSIVSGPINRAVNLLPQLFPKQNRFLNKPKEAIGLILLAIIKLFLLSDYLEKHLVNPVFSAPSNASSIASLISVIAYAWEIYMNFSGYTDLVRGIGFLLGFNLPRNFNAPYLAINLKDFWKRWHISLSRFITDYIYIPLGGNRCGFFRQNMNVMIAMFLSGIWHGVGLNFIIWGILHGLGLITVNIYHKIKILKNIIPLWLARFITLSFLGCTWIFFRAETYNDAITIFRNLLHLSLSSFLKKNIIIFYGLAFVTIFYVFIENIKRNLWNSLYKLPLWLYPLGIVVILTFVFMFAPAGTPRFIYANF